MAEDDASKKKKRGRPPTGSPVGWTLFVAYFGALVYFFQHAHSFWEYVFAFIQAAIWPAYVLHAVLKLLHI